MEKGDEMGIEGLIQSIEEYEKNSQFTQRNTTLNMLKKQLEKEESSLGQCVLAFYEGVQNNKNKLYKKSVACFYKALQYAKQSDNILYKVKCYDHLGMAYARQADYYSALKHYLKAYRLANVNELLGYKYIILNNIGKLFIWIEEFSSAMHYIDEAYEIYLEYESHNPKGLSEILLNMCEVESYSNVKTRFAYLYKKHQNDISKATIQRFEALYLLKQIRLANKVQQDSHVENEIEQFIKLSESIKSVSFFYRGCLELLAICTSASLYKPATQLLRIIETQYRPHRIASLDYRYFKQRVDYYQTFYKEDYKKQCEVYEEYFYVNLNFAKQFRKAYIQNVLVSLELDHSRMKMHNAYAKNAILLKEIEKDSFTGLLNKVYAKQYVSECLRKRKADSKQALILFDLDHFKEVNDLYGHQFGDEVILKSAAQLKTLQNNHCIAARFGGDEFFLFLDDVTHLSEVVNVVQQLLAFAKQILFPSTILYQTYSIGVAYLNEDTDFDEAFAIADRALYLAKEQGRNQATIVSKEGQIANIKG